MSTGIGDVYVNVLPNMEGFTEAVQAEVNDATSAAGDGAAAAAEEAATQTSDSLVGTLKESFSSVGSIVGIVFAGAFVKSALSGYNVVEKATNTLRFNLESIGDAGSLDNLTKWAEEFSLKTGVAEGTVLTMTSKLVGLGGAFFAAVGPDAEKYIEQTTTALTDLSVAIGRPVAGLMRSLGPSILNAPEKAVSSLKKWGALTDEQVKKVTDLVTAGNKLGATQEILNDLTAKYGGAAEAALTPLDKLHNDFDLVKDSVGKFLNPALTIFTDTLTSLPIPVQAVILGLTGLAGVAAKLVASVGSIGGVAKIFTESFAGIKRVVLAVIEKLAALTVANTAVAVSETEVTTAAVVEQLTLDGMAVSETAATVSTGVLAVAQRVLASSLMGAAIAAAIFVAAAAAVVIAGIKIHDYMTMDDKEGQKWADTILKGKHSLDDYRQAVIKVINQDGAFTTDEIKVAEAYTHAIEDVYAKMEATPGVLTAAEKATYKHAMATGHSAEAVKLLDGNMDQYLATQAIQTATTEQAVDSQKLFRESMGGIADQLHSGAITGTEATIAVASLAKELGIELPKGAAGAVAAMNGVDYNLDKVLGKMRGKITNVFSDIGISTRDFSQDAKAAFQSYTDTIAAGGSNRAAMTDWRAFVSSTMDSARSAIDSFKSSAVGNLDFVASTFDTIASDFKGSSQKILHAITISAGKERQFGKDLQTILADGGKGAKILAQHLLDLGPAGAKAAHTLATGADDARTLIEGVMAHSKTFAESTADKLSRTLVTVMKDIRDTLDDIFAKLNGTYTTQINFAVNDSSLTTALNLIPHGKLGYAKGGPVFPGQTYLVGEEGPEIFTSKTAGQIIPNHEIKHAAQESSGAEGKYALEITNWERGTGYIRKLARDESDRGRAYG